MLCNLDRICGERGCKACFECGQGKQRCCAEVGSIPSRLQGTAATAVAGVYGPLRVQRKSNKELPQQRIVLVGAGSAGMGVARMLALGMVKQVCLLPFSCSCPLEIRLCVPHTMTFSGVPGVMLRMRPTPALSALQRSIVWYAGKSRSCPAFLSLDRAERCAICSPEMLLWASCSGLDI